jgi:hypothetical protein
MRGEDTKRPKVLRSRDAKPKDRPIHSLQDARWILNGTPNCGGSGALSHGAMEACRRSARAISERKNRTLVKRKAYADLRGLEQLLRAAGP